MDPNLTMLEVNPAQLEVLESLMQLRNEEPNTSQSVVCIPIQGTEEAVQTSVIQMEGEADTENQLVTIVPMEDVQSTIESSDKMVTFIAVDEMGNRIQLPDDVVTFVSVDDEGNTIQLDGSDLTPEQMQVIQVGMDLEAAGVQQQQDGGSKVNFFQGGIESIEVYKCDLCRQVFTKRSDWDDHECPGHDDQDVGLQPLSIQLEQQHHIQDVVIKEEDDSTLECNLCRRTFALRENWEQHMLSHLDKIEARPNTELEMKQLSIMESGSNAVVLSAKTGDVEYRCDACGKRYQEKSDLEKHLVTHIVDKFYECPICSNAFATKFSLRKHVINHLKGKGKPFKCELCEKAFNQKVNLRAHMSVHTGLREFKCHICNKEFSLKGNLNKHLRIHTEDRPYKCGICHRSFKVKEYLIQHRLTHSNELPFACGQCGRRFKLQEYADRHTLKCDGTRTSICEQCGMTYTSRGDLNRHIDEVHPEMKPYQCETCNKRFRMKSYLQQHELSHTSGRNWVCGVCKKDFKCRNSLRQHLLWHTRQEKNEKYTCTICGKEIQYELNMKRHMLLHSGNMPFTCTVCQRGFPDSSHLRRHMMRHNGDKPHKCELCGKGFYTTTHLKRHVQTHSSLTKPHACKICGKGFITEEKMTRHFETHYGAVKGRFKCKYCEKACNKRSDLARHTLIHTGEKPYKCDICGMAFRTSTHRKRHLLTHTTEKPFKCSECNKAFKSRDVLKKHASIHKEGKSGWKKYCPKCGKGFKFVFNLREHEKHGCDVEVVDSKSGEGAKKSEDKKAEEVDRPYKCALCTRTFKTLQYLSRHESKHNDDEGETSLLDDDDDDDDDDGDVDETEVSENETQCSKCDKQFEDKESCQKHHSSCKVKIVKDPTTINYLNKTVKQVNKKPTANQCSLCGKVFIKGSHALKQHISLMHKEEDFTAANSPVPDSFHKCGQCGKLFAQEVNWKKHILTHREEGEVSLGEYVEDALETDAVEKAHKCGFCSVSFRESTNLVKHLLALHYKHPVDDTIAGAFTATSSSSSSGKIIDKQKESEDGGDDDANADETMDDSTAEKQSEADVSESDRPVEENRAKPYKCEKCKKLFGHITFLNKHVLSHHQRKERKKQNKKEVTTSVTGETAASEFLSADFSFTCDDCGVKFRTPGGLNRHKESHCQNVDSCEEGSPYKSPEGKTKKESCNICDGVFISTSTLLKHMRKAHKDMKHPCYVCGKGYAKESGLKQHITVKHGEPRTPKTAKIQPEIVSSERKFTCNHCQRGFRTESQLKRHIPTHKAEMDDFITDIKKEPVSPVPAAYSCTSCPETFNQHSELKSHMLELHTDEEEDSNSDKMSVEEYSDSPDFEIVRGGRQTELSVAVQKLPVCDVCGRWFSKEPALRSHMISAHGGEGSKNAELFDDEAMQSDEIESPDKSVTLTPGPVLFHCQFCDNTFLTRFTLNRHVEVKHKKEKPRTRSQIAIPVQKQSKLSPRAKAATPVQTPAKSSKPAQTKSKSSTPVRTPSKSVTPVQTPTKSSKSSTPVRTTSRSATSVQASSKASTSVRSQSKSTPAQKTSKSSSPIETTRSSDRSFHCRSCKREFRTESQLNRHKRTHDREDASVMSPFRCEACPKVFYRYTDLKTHMSAHGPGDVKSEDGTPKKSPKKPASKQSGAREQFKCDICDKSFAQSVNLKRHMFYHASSSDVEPDEDIVQKSPKNTPLKTTEAKLKSKSVAVKTDTVTSKNCNICKKGFSSLLNVKVHMINAHNAKDSESVVHKCSICKKAFSSFWDLKKHKLIRHRRKPEQSEIMKKNITEKIKKSIFTPSGERITRCEVCNGWFPNIQQHMVIHEDEQSGENATGTNDESKGEDDRLDDRNKKFVCEVCGKSFAREINFKMHKMVHKIEKVGGRGQKALTRKSGSSVENVHECAICGKEFLKSSSLKMHIAAKHSEYRGENVDESGDAKVELDHLDPSVVNTCQYCSNDFSELSAWYTHKLTTCGDGMPQCICCDKMFKKTWNLKIHYFRVHNIRSAVDVTEQGSSRLVVEHTYCLESGLEAMQCPHCSKKFTAQQKLRQHLKTHKKKGLADGKSQETCTADEVDDNTLNEISITLPEHSVPDPVESDAAPTGRHTPNTDKGVVPEHSVPDPIEGKETSEPGSEPMEVGAPLESESDLSPSSFIVTLNEEEKKGETESPELINSVDASLTNAVDNTPETGNAGLSQDAPVIRNKTLAEIASESMQITSEEAPSGSHTTATDDASKVDAASIDAVTCNQPEGIIIDTQLGGNVVDATLMESETSSGNVENNPAVYTSNLTTVEVASSDGIVMEMQTDPECGSSVTYYEETISNPDGQTDEQNELYEQAVLQLVEAEKRHKCEVCGRQCATPWSLKQHMETHGDATPVTEQSFAQMLDLVQTGNSAPYKCDVCSRTFSKSSQLTRHKSTHKKQQQTS